MSESNIPSRHFGTNNARVFLEGNGIVSRITNSKHCSVFARNSTIIIDASSAINVQGSDSKINLVDSTNARVTGNETIITIEKGDNFLLHGDNSTIFAQNVKGLVWSGSNGQCDLCTGKDLRNYGNGNQIMGKSNWETLICGHDNYVVANYSVNLKVRGHKNQVRATKTCSLIVEGDSNLVRASNVKVAHIVRKAPPGLDMGFSFFNPSENQIMFCGIPKDSSVYTEILRRNPPMPLTSPLILAVKSSTKEPQSVAATLKCVCDEFFPKNNNTSTTASLVMPQILVNYQRQLIINGHSYWLGEFHIECLHHSNEPFFRVRLVKPMQHVYHFIAPDKKSVTFRGEKETLKLVGAKISENVNGFMQVYYYEGIDQEIPLEEQSFDNEDVEMDDFDPYS